MAAPRTATRARYHNPVSRLDLAALRLFSLFLPTSSSLLLLAFVELRASLEISNISMGYAHPFLSRVELKKEASCPYEQCFYFPFMLLFRHNVERKIHKLVRLRVVAAIQSSKDISPPDVSRAAH